MAGIIRAMDAIKANTEIMTEGPGRTSDENIGNNAGGSGSIGTAKMLQPLFPRRRLGLPRRRPLTYVGKSTGAEEGEHERSQRVPLLLGPWGRLRLCVLTHGCIRCRCLALLFHAAPYSTKNVNEDLKKLTLLYP